MKTLTKKIKSKKGFTIVELLVAMAILGLLTATIATSMTGSLSVYKTTVAHSESSVLISTLSKSINDELRYARDIKNDATKGFTYTSTTYGKDSNIEIDKVEEANKGGKVVIMNKGNLYQLLGSGAYTSLEANTEIIYNETDKIFTVKLEALNGDTVINSKDFDITPINQ